MGNGGIFTLAQRRAQAVSTIVNNDLTKSGEAAALLGFFTLWSLTAIVPASFGTDLINRKGASDVSIASGTVVLTSPSNPWTTADVGRTVYVQGAGAAGATLRTVIAEFTSAGSVKLAAPAKTTVAATSSSASGVACWGDLPSDAAARPRGTSASEVSVGIAVEDYGAKGDGTTDDYEAINAAGVALATAGGGRLKFRGGRTYLIGTGLALSSLSDFVIEGNGATLKMADAAAADAAHVLLTLTSCLRFAITDLVLDGNRANRTPNAAVQCSNLVFTGCSHFAVERLRLVNACLDGMYANAVTAADLTTGTAYGLFKRVVADNSYRNGLSLTNGHDLTFVACSFVNSTGSAPQAGVDLEPNVADADGAIDAIRFYGCRFSGHVGLGLSIASQSKPRNIVVHGCKFTACAAGAISVGGRDVRITGNEFHDFTASTRGIIDVPAPGSALWNEAIIIADNVFRTITATQPCVYTHGSSGGKIGVHRNEFSSVYQVAIFNVQFCEFLDNVVDTCSNVAVQFPATAKYGKVANNIFRSVASYSTYVASGCDFTDVRGNTYVDCNNTVAGATAGTVHILAAGCTVYDNTFVLATTPDATHYAVRTSTPGTADCRGNNISGYSTNDALKKVSGTLTISGLNPGWGEATLTLDPASIAGGAELTLGGNTVPGAIVGDDVKVFAPYDLQGIQATAYVTGNNTVAMRLHNGTAGAIDLASGSWKFRLER